MRKDQCARQQRLMLNIKSIFLRLAIATKIICVAQIFVYQGAYADSTSPVIQLEMPNSAWWHKVAQSQNPKDIYFNAAANLSGLKMLAQVRERMINVASQPVHIAIQNSGTVNAFARQESGYNLIIFTTGFIQQFGNDADVLANTLGHELAHHALGHINSKSEPESLAHNDSGLVLAKRDVLPREIQAKELDADKAGIEYAIKAGYSACGGYRLFAYLKNTLPHAMDASQSSHPAISERMDLANKINMKLQKGQCS